MNGREGRVSEYFPLVGPWTTDNFGNSGKGVFGDETLVGWGSRNVSKSPFPPAVTQQTFETHPRLVSQGGRARGRRDTKGRKRGKGRGRTEGGEK